MTEIIDQEQKEYNKFIKASVTDGTYFRDAREWYMARYVEPVCHRTVLFFINIIFGFVTYMLVITIVGALPMREERAIVVKSKDQSRYFSNIVPLRNSVDLKSVDEAVLKYLLTEYVKKREGFDFRNTTIEDLNNQLNYVKNNSSIQEYKDFQNFLNRDNPNSPLIYFGRDFQRIINVDSVEFAQREITNLTEQAKFLIARDVPVSANVRYTMVTKVNAVTSSSQKFLVTIDFRFSGINPKNNDRKLDFLVNSYKIFQIK